MTPYTSLLDLYLDPELVVPMTQFDFEMGKARAESRTLAIDLLYLKLEPGMKDGARKKVIL